MSRRLKPFGQADREFLCPTAEQLAGHLQSLIDAEEDRGVDATNKGPLGRRLSKAYDALQILEEIST